MQGFFWMHDWVALHPVMSFLMLPLIIWSMFWKGMGLWTAARREDTPWFVAILIVNSLGVLEILYLYIVLPHRQRKRHHPRV